MYDVYEAVVCFLSDEVDECMDEFREVWENERVQDCGHRVRGYVCLFTPMSWVMYFCGSACSREYG